MIELDGVSLSYRSDGETVSVLNQVSFRAEAGTVTVLSGVSGAGKSSLLHVAAGLVVPDSGRVTVMGEQLDRLTDDARARARLVHIGVVFQESNLISEFTAAENIQVPLRARGSGRVEARAEAAKWLRRVGLDGLGSRRPSRLSGGQRQRVGIARALAGGRGVLLADEPTGALDAANSLAIFQLLREIADSGVAVVIASHDSESERFADLRIRIVDGRIHEVGSTMAAT